MKPHDPTLSPPVIALAGIVKSYPLAGEQVHALRGIDLHLGSGDFVAVRGPSGSGKSTLLNICGLLDGYDSGSYHFNGTDIAGLSAQQLTLLRRQYLGFIFQSYNLVPVMTVRENIAYPLQLAGVGEPECRQRVDAMLEQVGLGERADYRPDLLSGGQRQRVAIARALIKAPALVIADEPTANLDTHTANQVIDLMRQLGHQQGTTFLVATHDERMTTRCDHTLTMTDGVLQ